MRASEKGTFRPQCFCGLRVCFDHRGACRPRCRRTSRSSEHRSLRERLRPTCPAACVSRFALIDNKERRLRDTHIRSRPAGVSLTSDTLGLVVRVQFFRLFLCSGRRVARADFRGFSFGHAAFTAAVSRRSRLRLWFSLCWRPHVT